MQLFLRGWFDSWLYNIVCGKVKERHQKNYFNEWKSMKKIKKLLPEASGTIG